MTVFSALVSPLYNLKYANSNKNQKQANTQLIPPIYQLNRTANATDTESITGLPPLTTLYTPSIMSGNI